VRDRRTHKKFLESQKRSEITFTPIRVQEEIAAHGVSHLEIQGTMNLHGNDHGITISAEVQPARDQLTARTQFPIPYVNGESRTRARSFFMSAPRLISTSKPPDD
jgi:hypothetical protein